MRKKKLSIDEQIDYMKDKSGIQFNIVNEEEAKKFLTNNNYYFKIKSYAKNYEKYIEGENAGKYINLEFAYLKEMSTLDMYFRRIIIKMTLDIEHFLKIQLLRDFSRNDEEDGYNIIDDLFERFPYIEENIDKKSKNSTCSDLVTKYKGNFAIWNIVEAIGFGDFTKLYRIYYEKYKTKGSMEKHVWSVRFLRNAAAHNSCLLNSLRTPYSKKINPNMEVINFISKIDGISRKTRQDKMRNPIIHDFVVTLYIFNNIATSEGIKRNTMEELKNLIDNRFTANKEFFEKNQLIISYYDFVKKIIDYFYDLCI
ncbi:Abi family protein [Anaerosalibacter sp. Marseille-P3206]|uniref:Abi family protein n=1 Tax=Anaerosalibacter sp. Marseille-P3206 TaxID=1871005 RepID=UPI0009850528|nr:Abi family protein [Anaerosalibacter sp. Marseille-P3206]